MHHPCCFVATSDSVLPSDAISPGALSGAEVLRCLIDEEGGDLVCKGDLGKGLHEEKLSLGVDLEKDGLIVIDQFQVEDSHCQPKLTQDDLQTSLQVVPERVRTKGNGEIRPPVEYV